MARLGKLGPSGSVARRKIFASTAASPCSVSGVKGARVDKGNLIVIKWDLYSDSMGYQ